MQSSVVILFVAFFGLAACTDEITIRPCKAVDTVCFQASAQAAVPLLAAGVPSMGISVMDPMLVEQVKTTTENLQMDFRNTSVTGLSQCKVLSFRPSRRLGAWTAMDLKCSVTMKGDYSLDGFFLALPVHGNGRYSIKIHDIVVKMQFYIGEKLRDGDQYWIVKYSQFKSNVEKGVHFRFDNVYDGDEEFSDVVNTFANSKWERIYEEVGSPIVDAIVSQVVNESTKLFDKVPINKLVIE